MSMESQQNLLFIDTIFLQNFGLSRDNVLDYFALSPFWDSLSNNQAIRTQGASLQNLLNMQGLEFAIEPNKNEPKLFIIKKQKRSSHHNVELIEIYYVSKNVHKHLIE